MSLFTLGLDGKPINISLVQTVLIDPNDDTDVIWFMKNGEKIREDLGTKEEAQNRYNDIIKMLLGTEIAELQERIVEQQNTIVQQQETIVQTNNSINELTAISAEINGEEV